MSATAPPVSRSWKVGVKTPGDREWIYNGLRFASRPAAETYGRNLASRWSAIKAWEVQPSADAPTE